MRASARKITLKLRYITKVTVENVHHALALLPPSPRPLPLAAAEDADALAMTPPLLPIALRQLPAAEEWELQNESYVSKVALCAPMPADVTGPGAVGMSNVLDDVEEDEEEDVARKDESGVFGGCVDAGGGGFCGGGAGGGGECGCLDVGGGGAGAGGGTNAGVDAGAGEAEWCV